MGISCELFEEMRDKVMGVYIQRRSQIAPSPTSDFQKDRNQLTLDEVLKITVGTYIFDGKIEEAERIGLIFHLKREVLDHMRLEGPKPKVRPKKTSTHRNNEFLYETLGVTRENFRREFAVSEEDLWDMLANIAEQYEKAKRKYAMSDQAVRQRQIKNELLYAARQIVNQSEAGEIQRKNLYHALLQINGRAGGNAKHQSYLQPSLPFAS